MKGGDADADADDDGEQAVENSGDNGIYPPFYPFYPLSSTFLLSLVVPAFFPRPLPFFPFCLSFCLSVTNLLSFGALSPPSALRPFFPSLLVSCQFFFLPSFFS
jgi:hypothetical protein